MIKSSVKIGAVVKIDGLKLTVKEWSNEMDCRLCHFFCTEECDNMPCKAYERADKKNVYFGFEDFPYKQIGEIFRYGDFTLEVCTKEEIFSYCAECHFSKLPCNHVPCLISQREDGKAVYYKRLNK